MTLKSFEQSDASLFNVPYPVPSSSLTTGNASVTTTAGDYWGYAVQVSSAPATIIVYNSTTAVGVIIDIATVTASTMVMQNNPILARVGISVNLTGTNSKATVFYTPKG